jgi:cytoskeletal protein RodZ
MALSADEQRELAEIERRLATDDPGLATCLAAFRRPGPSRVLRSPRARIIGSLFTVLLVAMVSLMVYAMIPFRAHNPSSQTTAGTSATPASTDGQARNSPLASASTGATATGAASPAPPSAAASTGTSQAKPTESQAEGQVASSAAGP